MGLLGLGVGLHKEAPRGSASDSGYVHVCVVAFTSVCAHWFIRKTIESQIPLAVLSLLSASAKDHKPLSSVHMHIQLSGGFP